MTFFSLNAYVHFNVADVDKFKKNKLMHHDVIFFKRIQIKNVCTLLPCEAKIKPKGNRKQTRYEIKLTHFYKAINREYETKGHCESVNLRQ